MTSIYRYKRIENQTIIYFGDKSISIPNETFNSYHKEVGFSIKSMIGSDSTLFNPAAGTNFVFKLIKPTGMNFDLKHFNNETFRSTEGTRKSKITLRLNELEKLGFKFEFVRIQSENLQLNLQLIDSQLPEILAHIIYNKFNTGKSKMTDLLSMLNEQNPLKFNLTSGHPFYEYKIKNFLSEVALGMTPEAVFTGKYDATGGIIIVKDDGDIVCYHIYNKNEFQTYLLNNTKLDQPSTSEDNGNPGSEKVGKTKPYKYGWVYEENNQLYFKLNLQIRFLK